MDANEALETFVDKNMFFAPGGDVWDFTLRPDQKLKTKKRPAFFMANEQVAINYPLPLDGNELKSFASKFTHYLNCKNVMIGWGLKDIFSYFYGKTGYRLVTSRPILDLKVLESLMAYKGDRPENYAEAAERLAKVTRYSRWEQIKSLYGQVFLPLIKEVLPAIESTGLVRGRRRVHPHYEIEGQANGRLKGSNAFKEGFNPHSLSKDEMHNYLPGEYGDLMFIVLDYASLEVRVLQWLSRDAALKEILETGEDVYKIIWERITSVKCSPAYREVCKSIFLPIMYGLGTKTLSRRLKVDEWVAERLKANVCAEFPAAMAWVRDQQNSNDYDGFVYDHYGRRRRFDGKEHRIRNFVVQAPASIVCLHKLVQLFDALKGFARIACHVHDGYMVTVKKKDLEKNVRLCVDTLEKPDDLYAGLDLKVTVKVGERLHQLETV